MNDPPAPESLPPSGEPLAPIADQSRGGESAEVLALPIWDNAGPPAKPQPSFAKAIGWLVALLVVQAVVGFIAGIVFYLFIPIPAFLVCVTVVTTLAFACLGVRAEYGAIARRVLAIRSLWASQVVLVVILTFPLVVLCAEAAGRTAQALGRTRTPVSSTLPTFQSFPNLPRANLFDRIDRYHEALNKLPWVLALLFGAVVPAVGEELLFRGLIGRGLVARHGPVLGVLLTSLLFGLFHIDPVRIAATFVMGVIFHAVYLATRSLAAPILLHALNNTLSIAAAKVLSAYQSDHTGQGGSAHVPPLLLVASAGAVVAIVWALVRMRPRWLMPDGSVWSPGFVSAESPPPEAGATVRAGRLGLGSALTLAVALLAFGAVVGLGLRNGRANQLAYQSITRGNELLERGDFDAAIEFYSEAIRIAPNNATGYANRGLAISSRGDPAQALPDLDRALKLNPALAEAYEGRASVLFVLGRMNEARADFDTLMRIKPPSGGHAKEWGVYFVRCADAAVRANDLASAREDLNRALQLDLTLVDAYRLRAFVSQSQGMRDQAIADYMNVLFRKPDDSYALGNRGICELGKGELDAAIADLTDALRHQPENADFLMHRGTAYQLKNDIDRATADYTASLNLEPNSVYALSNRGRLRLHKGELDPAITDLTEAIRLGPANTQVRSDRGEAHFLQREFDKAIADFTEAIRLDPNNGPAHTFRGLCYANKREFDKAISDYTEAIRIAPDFAAYANRGSAFMQKQEFEKAIADYTAAIHFNPNSASMYAGRGTAHNKMKEFDKAIADYGKAVSLEPKTDFALNSQAWLLATCSEAKYRDGKKAVELARKVCELSGWKNATWLDTLAAAYAEAGKFDEAVKWQEKALTDAVFVKQYGADAKKRLQLYKENRPYHDE